MNETPQYSYLTDPIPMPPWLAEKEAAFAGRAMAGDEEKMRFVVELAVENVRRETGGPFAAAIFEIRTDILVAVGVNRVVPARQSWAHAEMTAFAHAQNKLGSVLLAGCMLVTSCEPCAMCCGATPWSGVERMIYGATKEMAESVGFDDVREVAGPVLDHRLILNYQAKLDKIDAHDLVELLLEKTDPADIGAASGVAVVNREDKR